jgi:hypothetical protein
VRTVLAVTPGLIFQLAFFVDVKSFRCNGDQMYRIAGNAQRLVASGIAQSDL